MRRSSRDESGNGSGRPRRRVCYVTGTRAEFGLMRSTLQAIRAHPTLKLQLVVTGMHLDRTRGNSIDQIRAEGWTIDRAFAWPAPTSAHESAMQTGLAMAQLAESFSVLRSDIVLVVGDRVEAFAAAAAAHIAGCVVAHVHGGDRALGQVDDSLRHAITKLAHVHFAATRQSAQRIQKLGEDPWRIHLVGSPGLDDLHETCAPPRRGRAQRRPGLASPDDPIRGGAALCPGVEEGARTALVLLHPVDENERVEYERARVVLRAVRSVAFECIDIIYPNTDPGAAGIVRCWDEHATDDSRIRIFPDLPRAQFLGLLQRAVVLVGNSSSGIIEAASFRTPVIDVGPRQLGRERSQNVTNVPYDQAAIRRALRGIWNGGRPKRFRGRNVYGGGDAGRRIAAVLAQTPIASSSPDSTRLIRRKLIAY